MEFFRLIRLLAWKEPDKNEVMGELCRIIRHLQWETRQWN